MRGGIRAGAGRKPGSPNRAAVARWEAFQLETADRLVSSYPARRPGPDPFPSRAVCMLAAVGLCEAAIARLVGVDVVVLKNSFGKELAHGGARARATFITKVFEKAASGNAAALLWLMKRTEISDREERG